MKGLKMASEKKTQEPNAADVLCMFCLIIFIMALMAAPLSIYFVGWGAGVACLATSVIASLLAILFGRD